MKENGLSKAILAAGGMRALAKLLRISHQSISKWRRVPAERVVQIERATGVKRQDIRPDLYR